MPKSTIIAEEKEVIQSDADRNRLFPVFLKLEQLPVLLVGGGKVALEKLQALIANEPSVRVKIVAGTVIPEVRSIADSKPGIELHERLFEPADCMNQALVIVAVNDIAIANDILKEAHAHNLLVNVADTPDLCDFYLGSIVQKGSIKIAISTNGKSPTIAKRLKQVINDFLPDQLEDVLKDLQHIRKGMTGDFDEKVKKLNDITRVLVSKHAVLDVPIKKEQSKWQKIVLWSLLAFLLMIVGHAILSYIPFGYLKENMMAATRDIDSKTFILMLITGFFAQMADGSMGMGYGTISTTFLLAYGVSPAIVSSRVHAARVFSSGVSGYSHHRFGNINKKMFRALVIPGVIGAVIGAAFAFFGQKYSSWVRVPLSVYTMYLGYFIIRKAFRKKKSQDKVKRVGWLASIGGFMDAFAGGGWGALVTSTLISKRRSPRYVIGSVCLAEFFVVFTSSITFFILLKSIPLLDVAGLIAGGLIAAPIAARLVGKLPMKTMFIAVGLLVILTSSTTLWKSLMNLLG